MDLVHVVIHGLGLQGWSMDQESLFCIRPFFESSSAHYFPLSNMLNSTCIFIVS